MDTLNHVWNWDGWQQGAAIVAVLTAVGIVVLWLYRKTVGETAIKCSWSAKNCMDGGTKVD